MSEALILEPDPASAPQGVEQSRHESQPFEDGTNEQHDHDFDRESLKSRFDEVVAGLELDPSLEGDASVAAVLGLAADTWNPDEEPSTEEVIGSREWLLDTMLRAAGGKSNFVRSNELKEYLPDNDETEAFGALFAKHGQNKMSQGLASGVAAIAAEFHFDEKFPDQEEPELEYCVVPADDHESLAPLINGAGAYVDLPGGKVGIVINEASYVRAFDENSQGSRGFIAHELGHARRELAIGDGTRPLGHMINELYAEWCGDDKNGYYDEKHMSNLLAATGFDIRKQYLPKLASGELSTADLIHDLSEQFGKLNTLRLLAYAPANYTSKYEDDPASLIGDCIDYALEHGKTTPDELQANIESKYTPGLAKIIITNNEISPLVPHNLRPIIERYAASVST